jgi:hypothetical protein
LLAGKGYTIRRRPIEIHCTRFGLLFRARRKLFHLCARCSSASSPHIPALPPSLPDASTSQSSSFLRRKHLRTCERFRRRLTRARDRFPQGSPRVLGVRQIHGRSPSIVKGQAKMESYHLSTVVVVQYMLLRMAGKRLNPSPMSGSPSAGKSLRTARCRRTISNLSRAKVL